MHISAANWQSLIWVEFFFCFPSSIYLSEFLVFLVFLLIACIAQVRQIGTAINSRLTIRAYFFTLRLIENKVTLSSEVFHFLLIPFALRLQVFLLSFSIDEGQISVLPLSKEPIKFFYSASEFETRIGWSSEGHFRFVKQYLTLWVDEVGCSSRNYVSRCLNLLLQQLIESISFEFY